MQLMLAARGVDATVTLAHSRLAGIAAVTREANIPGGGDGTGRSDRRTLREARRAVFDVDVDNSEELTAVDWDRRFVGKKACEWLLRPLRPLL